ncbi:MAG: T9SS type A sorting domain-containing protein [Bacteroidales bacterium]|nr:T9SS type A sorting domain-containing protein [Bacteroidales bacterium]
MKKKFTFLLAALVLLGGLVGPMGKAKAQSISPSPSSLSFSYAVGNETPIGEYVYVSCANLGEGNNVTVSLSQGENSHFELWDVQVYQNAWNNVTEFTATTTDPNLFGFGFNVRLKPGYAEGTFHSDVVNLTATVNGSMVSATITLTGEVTAPTYNIDFSVDVENYHGYAGCHPSNANVAGTLVTLRPYPNQGYVLGPWTIYEKSTHRDVTNEVGLNGLTFTMPAYDILIEVSFVPVGETTPQITVPTVPLSFTYASGTLNPKEQYITITGINLGENLGTEGYYISCNPNSHSNTFQLSNHGMGGWTADDHSWFTIFPTDPTEFSFYLGVRMKPGLEVGTYSDVLAVTLFHAGQAVQSYNINLSGTVTECVELQATNLQVLETAPHGFNFSFTPSSSYTGDEEWYWSITTENVTPEYQWGIGYTIDPTWDNENHPNVYSNTQYYLWIGTRCGEDNFLWNTPSVPFTTEADCEVADEDFYCGADKHGLYLAFYNGRDWQVQWSANNVQPGSEPVTVTGSYYSITGLDGDTDYHVWVRTECEQDWYGHKQWSEWRKIDTHTKVACAAPESVMAYGVTGTTATVWWFGAPYEDPSWTVYLKARDHWGDWHSYTTNQNYFNFTSAQFDDEGGTNWEDWTWDVYVTRNCGGEDGESAPSKTITFTTEQNQDHIVNDGQETNTQVPFEGNNANYLTMSQFIIPAKDLETMRYSNVSSMTFYCQEASVDWSSNAKFDVYLWNMPCGSENGFSGQNFFPWDDMEKVCEAKNLSITDYQMQVLFDETFLYTDGNLLVGIKQVQTGTYAACSWVGDYTNYNAAVTAYREDEQTIYYDDELGFVPKVKFAYESTHPISAKPFHPEANPLDSRTVVFSWSPADDEMSWEVAFGKPGIFKPYDKTTWLNSLPIEIAHCQYTLSNHPNIQPEQEYEFVVRALGWDSSWGNQIPLSDWTCPVSFTMPATCEATDIQVTDITATDATISWEGAENANVRYREAQILSENFDRESVDNLVSYSVGWKIINESDNTGNAIKLNANTYMGDEGKSFQFYSYYSNTSSTSYDQYLITPEIAAAAKLSFYYQGPSDEYEEYFRVGYSSTDNNKGSFTWGDVVTVNSTTWTEYTAIIPEGTKYVAIYYNPGGSRMYLYIDNFTIGNPNSTWSEQPARMPFDICCLTPETTYEFQLQPKCGGSNNGDWTDATYFTTRPVKRFVGQEGEEFSHWNVASNWSPEGVPTIYEDVIIEHKAWIAGNQEGTARNITLTGENYLLLQEGAQLKHSNSGVLASLQKVFYPYTGDNDHFYLVAPPTDEAMNPSDIWLFLDDPYDLYRFDQSSEKEWRNYKQTPFNLEPATGYLYAQGYQYETTVNFEGELNPSENDYTILLRKDENANLSGWNLVGNPFACNAVIGRPFYRIQETANGSELVPASGNIAPLEGVFVQASTDGERLSFSRYGATSQNAAQPTVGINVMQSVTTRGNESTALVDKALVRFGEGQGLEKFQLNPKHTKLYVPLEGRDYAVACSQASQGEMPLNFKAEKDGTYTLSFDVENVEMDYLHLIDNMTGEDVDLLASAGTSPSLRGSGGATYTFTAKTTDYASRFRLVFGSDAASGDACEPSFAFFNGSEWVVSNQGRATLQVVDVMGRVLSSEQIDGNAEVSINQPAGVYMLRLVSGDSVKVQKVVVR